MTRYTWLILILFLTNCRERTAYTEDAISSSECLIDSIIIPNADMYYGSIAYVKANNDLRICCVSQKHDQVYMYNGKAKVDSIRIPRSIKYEEFQFTIDSGRQVYYLAGNYIYKCLDSVVTVKYTYFPDSIGLSATFFRFEVINGTCVLDKIPNKKMYVAAERIQYFKADHLGLFTLRNDTIVELSSFAKFPGEYAQHSYHEVFPLACRLNKDSVAYMFSLTNEMTVQNVYNGQKVTYPVSGLAENRLVPENTDSIRMLAYSTKYELGSNKYVNVTFDEVSRNMAVIQMLKLDANQSGPYMAIFEDKPFVVNIVDAEHKVRKKIRFNNNIDMRLTKTAFLNNRLYLSKFSNNKITVYVYKTN